MARGISMGTRLELVEVVGERYKSATRAEKTRILDEFVAVTGYHRKHAVRLLRHGVAKDVGRLQTRRRVYDEAVKEALVVVWEAADRICGKRLIAVLPDFVTSLERHGHLQLDVDVRDRLLAMSPATVDRMLAPVRATAKGRRRRRGTATSVKRQVPVRTFADWDDPAPGHFEMDFVEHNGGSTSGRYVHSLVLTDVATGWTESVALVAREQSLVVEGLEILQAQLPVEIQGLDTDNDSAFLNETVLDYCRGRGIEFTRSRAYRKNDQAWIEQKNGSVVRRFTGYGRFVGIVAAQMLSHLYQQTRLFVNFFQPSFKLRAKTKVGSKVKKSYFPPATPCERLIASNAVSEERKQRLTRQKADLDPVRLLHSIREAQTALAALASTSTGDPPVSKSLQEFLTQLPYLWHQGEVRATHRPQPARPRTYRTRPDPFASVWPELLGWLQQEPDSTASILFDRLTAKYPGRYTPGQLRTLQRRVRGWRRAIARELVYACREGADTRPSVPAAAAPTASPSLAERA